MDQWDAKVDGRAAAGSGIDIHLAAQRLGPRSHILETMAGAGIALWQPLAVVADAECEPVALPREINLRLRALRSAARYC